MAIIKNLSCVALLLHLLHTPLQAKKITGKINAEYCKLIERTTKAFDNYNSTKTYKIPALRLEEYNEGITPLVEDEGKTWDIIVRLVKLTGSNRHSTASHILLDVGDSNTTIGNLNTTTGNSNSSGIKYCATSVFTRGTDKYRFSKKVLERSLDDNGDCRTMLGSRCVDALEAEQRNDVNGCSILGAGKLPTECSGLLEDDIDAFPSGMAQSGNLSSSIEERWEDNRCATGFGDNFEHLNSSIRAFYEHNGQYEPLVRFPTPFLFKFYPIVPDRKQNWEANWSQYYHPQIRCLRPDEIQEGSEVPRTAQEILDDENTKYGPEENAAGILKPFTSYLIGAVALAAIYL